jgi:hypothetical protein
MVDDLPHLQISIPEPEPPMMPPMRRKRKRK